MKRIIAIACFAAAAGACASSAEIRQGAYEHQSAANAARARGDYYMAAHEQAAANKQFAKANQRAYNEAYPGYWW
jgi:hypothetical protein